MLAVVAADDGWMHVMACSAVMDELSSGVE
jgi:hypothetical protein